MKSVVEPSLRFRWVRSGWKFEQQSAPSLEVEYQCRASPRHSWSSRISSRVNECRMRFTSSSVSTVSGIPSILKFVQMDLECSGRGVFNKKSLVSFAYGRNFASFPNAVLLVDAPLRTSARPPSPYCCSQERFEAHFNLGFVQREQRIHVSGCYVTTDVTFRRHRYERMRDPLASAGDDISVVFAYQRQRIDFTRNLGYHFWYVFDEEIVNFSLILASSTERLRAFCMRA